MLSFRMSVLLVASFFAFTPAQYFPETAPPAALASVGTVIAAPLEIRPSSANYETAYQDRLSSAANSQTWPVGSGAGDTDVGKRDWPALLAEMWKDRNNSGDIDTWISGKGRELLFSSEAGRFFKPFSCPGYMMYYRQFCDRLPQEQIDKVKSQWETNGREYTSRGDHAMDPIYELSEYNSENFNWMARTAGAILSDEYDDTTPIEGTPAQEWYEGWIKNWARALYHTGRVEWNSEVYFGYLTAWTGSRGLQVGVDPETAEASWREFSSLDEVAMIDRKTPDRGARTTGKSVAARTAFSLLGKSLPAVGPAGPQVVVMPCTPPDICAGAWWTRPAHTTGRALRIQTALSACSASCRAF
jgi:hypothetical protein